MKAPWLLTDRVGKTERFVIMQFKIQVKPKNRNDSWWEPYNKPEVVDQATAERAGQALVDYFNSTLRPGESPRTLLAVMLEGNAVQESHQWVKTSLTGLYERGRLFDRMRCEGCGITGKRFNLITTVKDPQFRAKAFLGCDTARALLAKRQDTGSGKRR